MESDARQRTDTFSETESELRDVKGQLAEYEDMTMQLQKEIEVIKQSKEKALETGRNDIAATEVRVFFLACCHDIMLCRLY